MYRQMREQTIIKNVGKLDNLRMKSKRIHIVQPDLSGSTLFDTETVDTETGFVQK